MIIKKISDSVNGNTVLHCAAKNERFEELKFMIQAGGNPFIRNKLGQTTEILLQQLPATESNMVPEILELIEQLKNATPEEKNTSLVHEAVLNNNLERLRLYHKIGAPLHSYNMKGQTPKDLAEELDYRDIAKFLQENCEEYEEMTHL